MQPVRVAVIGAGYMGERHARIYAGLPDVELVAVCDVRESAAREPAARTGASSYADFRTLLRRDDLNAVSVCTPDGLHREPCEVALRGRRHVLVEKPIATTVADADAIVEAAAGRGSCCWSDTASGSTRATTGRAGSACSGRARSRGPRTRR